MKFKIIYSLLVLVVSSVLLVGCTSSDNTIPDTTTDTAVNTTTESDTRTAQAQTDAELAEDSTDTNISADNPIGNNRHLVALIRQNPNLSTLSELIRTADMVIPLESPGTYTFFAPTNEAFAALPAGTLDVLKLGRNKAELTSIIQSHILPNRVMLAEIKDNMPMKTTQGEEIIANRKGQVLTVGGAKVITADVEASNGIIHVIDRVLIPPKE